MANIDQQVVNASQRNQQLLAILAETDHAVPDSKQQDRYIADLETQLADTKRDLGRVAVKRNIDSKEHNKYKDSTFRRLAYKVSRKQEAFAEKAEQGEKEYFATLQREQQLKDQQQELERLLQEAQVAAPGLKEKAERHSQAQRELDQLYDSIFSGPNPNYPEEDEKERYAELALQRYHDVRTRFESEQQAGKLLAQAEQALSAALSDMSSAKSYSTMDMFGGGTLISLSKRDCMATAQRHYHNVQLFAQQAQHLSPQVASLTPVKVTAGSIMSDVFFDNIFTDMALHEKIKQSDAELRNTGRVLGQTFTDCQARQTQLHAELTQEEAKLEQARRDLQDVRASVFARLSQGA